MKKIVLTMVCAGAMMVSAFAQLLDEKNVTITMDLQPVLQLSLQGPDQIDFTFDNISEYYSGITKYGANILRVSASVSFDLWAVGLSTVTNFDWDQVVEYNAGGGANSISTIPITALELRQFPTNPSDALCAAMLNPSSDYSQAFAAYVQATNNITAGNNTIFNTLNTTPYAAPTSTGIAATSEKYIAGGSGTGAGCAVVGGSYLTNALTAGAFVAPGYFFVMDYRILPGLPVVFPAQEILNNTNGTAASVTNAADATLGITAGVYAEPGVYQMYIKYILVEDQ